LRRTVVGRQPQGFEVACEIVNYCLEDEVVRHANASAERSVYGLCRTALGWGPHLAVPHVAGLVAVGERSQRFAAKLAVWLGTGGGGVPRATGELEHAVVPCQDEHAGIVVHNNDQTGWKPNSGERER